MKRLILTQLLCLSLLISSPFIHAAVNHKTGIFTHDVSDILVQSIAGKIAVSRSWQDDQWVFDWSRAPLKLQYGVSSDYGTGIEISSIEHVGETFKHSSEVTTDTTMSTGGAGYHKRITYSADELNNQWFVREGDIAGQDQDTDAEKMLPIRWENRAGQWAIFLIPSLDATYALIDRYGNRNGLTASYVYDAQNRLININDRNGSPILTYTYNATDQLSEVRDNNSRRVEYHYTGDQLTEVRDVRGNLTRYAYENDRLVRITDQSNRVKEIAYGSTGRVSSVTLIETDGSRSTTSYRYDYDTTRKETYAQVRDPAGGVTEKWYDEESNLIRKAVNNIQVYSQTVDKANKRYHTRDQRNLQTIKQYDEWYNLIQVTHPDGSSNTASYRPGTEQVLERTDELGRITRYSYDTNGKLSQRIDAAGSDVERITQYRYDSNGLLIEKKRLGDADTQESVTTYGYDANGNLNMVTDPEGGITRLTHNIWGGVLTRTDPNNHTWHYTYDEAGNRLSQTDPLQQSVGMTYDNVGNRSTITDARTHTTRFTYNARNQQTSVTDPLNHVVQLNYDIAGQLLGTTDPLGNRQRITYDLSKRLISQQDAAGNQTTYGYGERPGEGGGLSGSVNYPGQLNRIQYPTYLQTYDYDNRNRRTRTIDHLESGPVVNTSSHDEVGNKVSTTDAEGRITLYHYDALNRLIEIIDPLNQTTRFSYDNRDNLIAVTDPNSHTTRYTYDRANRKTSETRPGGEIITYSYDAAGNLTTTTDPDGRRTVNTYDDANQLASQAHYAPGATEPERIISYSYDANGNLTGWSDGAISATLAYDENNRKTGETVNYGTFSLSHHYTYDAAGNKRTYTGPDNITITYHRVNDRLSRIEVPTEGSIVYNNYQWNRPTRITYPGGTNRQTEYDDLLRPTRILTQDPGENPLLDYQYSYDTTGNILQKATSDKSYAYQYDLLQRLTEAAATTQAENGEAQTETEGWQYDPNGNRTLDNLNPGNWVYDLNDRLQASPEVSYGYDEAGHMTSKTEGGVTTTYHYNAEGRLVRIEDGDQNQIATYAYDPLGRRVKKTTLLETVVFHYSDEGLVGEFSQTGSIIRIYGYQPDSTWTTDPIYQKSSEGYAYYQNDHLGTPQQLVQKSGAKVWEGEYRAFGALVAEEGSWGNRLRFPGQYYDQESGNFYNYYRDYDPSTGRYLQSDPIGLAGGLNTFVYVKNNPIVNLDFWGLHKNDKWWGRTNRNFQWWYHNCYKQPGDPDADKETIEDAYSEWQDRGSPKRGQCDDLPPPPPIVPEPGPDSSTGCDSDCEQIIKRVRDAAGVIIFIIITVCTGGAATT